MKLLCLLLAALPLSMAQCACGPQTPCPTTQPAACECENRILERCAEGTNCVFTPEDCSVFGSPVRCGSKGLAACPSDLPLCVNTPEQSADGCTIAADCPGFCVASSDEVCAGIAGIECQNPDATCVEDPRDDCNPLGESDCFGVCVFIKG